MPDTGKGEKDKDRGSGVREINTKCQRSEYLNKGKIKERDLEHLATAKALNLPIIAYDRDFEGIGGCVTPKRFLETLGIAKYETEY